MRLLVLDGWRSMPGTWPKPVEPSQVVMAELQCTPPSFMRVIDAAEELAEVRVFRGDG